MLVIKKNLHPHTQHTHTWGGGGGEGEQEGEREIEAVEEGENVGQSLNSHLFSPCSVL